MESEGKFNPPKREMPAFLQNLMQANQNIICTAKGSDVRRACMAELLRERLRIPIFQRRYCWGEDQWKTLLSDALEVSDGSKQKHALGRITCVKGDASSGDGRLLVVDGQQRNTTCSLLLAAIRDVVLAKHSEDAVCEGLASRLDSFLFPDTAAMEAWLSQSPQSKQIMEGLALEFAALIPTYCDRASYFAAILPPRAAVEKSCAKWHRPHEAKCYFIDQLHEFTSERLVCLAETVLYKLEWLLFPISVNDGHKDGTEDLQVIFERLAVRDATLCRPSRATEFASMGAADFIRNLLLGSFEHESDAIDMYKSHWLQIEQLAAEACVQKRSSDIAEAMEEMVRKFLKSQPEKMKKPSKAAWVVVGGDLYPQFRQWLTSALAADDSVVEGESESRSLERKTAELLRRLQAFAIDHFAKRRPDPEPEEVESACGLVLPLGRASRAFASNKWRCTRCSFPNSAGSKMCTACCMARP